MKLITIFLLLSTTIFAQNTINSFSAGVEVAPMLHTTEARNLQDGTMYPNFVMTYGNRGLKAVASLGAVSRFGFKASNEWVYSAAYYTVNSSPLEKVEHGAEIELGFNHNISENLELSLGASIGLMNQGRGTKLTLRPLVIGLSVKIHK